MTIRELTPEDLDVIVHGLLVKELGEIKEARDLDYFLGHFPGEVDYDQGTGTLEYDMVELREGVIETLARLIYVSRSYDEEYGGEGEGDTAGFYLHVEDSDGYKRTLHFSYAYSSWEGMEFGSTCLREVHWSDSQQTWVPGPETIYTILEDEKAILDTLAGLRARRKAMESFL